MSDAGQVPSGSPDAEADLFEKITRHLNSLGKRKKTQFKRDVGHRLGLDVPGPSLATLIFGNKQLAPSVVAVLVIVLIFITIAITLVFRPDNNTIISGLISLAGTAMGIAIGRHI
jgi:hypothetical protein